MALGTKWGKNGAKMVKKLDLGSFFYFFAILGPFFLISGAEGHFYVSDILSIFGFRPVFHSIRGGLTRNAKLHSEPGEKGKNPLEKIQKIQWRRRPEIADESVPCRGRTCPE